MANGLINMIFFLLIQYLTGDYWGLTVLGIGHPHFPEVVSHYLSGLGRLQPLLPGLLGSPWPPAGLFSGLLLMPPKPPSFPVAIPPGGPADWSLGSRTPAQTPLPWTVS